jgi:hypothetical protein
LRCLLLRSTGSYAFNPDHDFVADIFSNGGIEVSVASYARQTLGSKSITLDDTNNVSVFTFANIAFGALEAGQIVSGYVLYEFITNDAASPLICHVDGKVRVNVAAPATLSTSGSITGATQANPCVITSAAHGLLAGQKVYVSGVGGMTQLNNLAFTVANPTGSTFELSGINSTGYGAYTSGGTWNLAQKVYVDPLKEAINDGTTVSIGAATGTTVGAAVKGARVLYVRSLSAGVAEGDTGIVQSSLNLPATLGGGNFNINIPADGFLAYPGSV